VGAGTTEQVLMLERTPSRLVQRVRKADIDLRNDGLQSASLESPSTFTFQFAPRSGMREDFTDALCMQRESSNGYVTMLAGPKHVADRCDLDVRQALHHRTGQLGL
jgi:hypothetical protein